jgi:hypothetical protein
MGLPTVQSKLIQIGGLALTIAYATFIIWIYATEPRTFKEVTTSAEVAAGTYQINQEKFNSALNLFRREQFRAAREEWQQGFIARVGAVFILIRRCSSKVSRQ